MTEIAIAINVLTILLCTVIDHCRTLQSVAQERFQIAQMFEIICIIGHTRLDLVGFETAV